MTKRAISKVEPLLAAELKIDKNDILAISVAKHEAELEDEKKLVDSRIKKLEVELNADLKKFEKNVQAAVEGLVKTELADANKNLKKLGLAKSTAKVESFIEKPEDFRHEDDSDYEEEEDATPGITNGIGKHAYYRISLVDDRGYRLTVSSYSTAEFDAKAKETIAQLKAKEDELTLKRERAVILRSELANLAKKERQARARLAVSVLEQTEEGRAILAQVDNVKTLTMTD